MYLNTDHSGLNKYSSSSDQNFFLVQAEICRIIQTAPQTVEARYRCMTPYSDSQETSSNINYLLAYGIAKEEDSFRVVFSLKGIPAMDKFVGRDTEITRLVQLMIPISTDDMHRKVCILHGIGGVGKSQLAVEFARKHQKNFSAVFWIPSSTKGRLKRNIAALAQRLPEHQISERAKFFSKNTDKELDEVVEDVLKWFSQPSNNKWLLIFDNVDREYFAEFEDPEAFDIKEYLPEADQGSILITSRLAGMWRLVGKEIKLEPFDELQGELLLNSITEKPLPGNFNQKVPLQIIIQLIKFGRFVGAC